MICVYIPINPSLPVHCPFGIPSLQQFSRREGEGEGTPACSEHFPSLSLSLITGPTMGGRLLASSQQEPSLSDIATSAAHGEDSPYFAGWRAYDEDPYDPVTNPSGVIQMGLAENQVGLLTRSLRNASSSPIMFYLTD